VVAAAACAAVATAGCGLGPGASDQGAATLTVTRDYGAQKLDAATVTDPTESDTVIRVLDREADITTRYGGKFVQSINGIEGNVAGGRVSDWFFFVNGIESSTGAADVPVRAGDRIWWDYRDWTAAMRAPAVVGSWPEPFAQASAGTDRLPVQVVCYAKGRPPCRAAVDHLADAGVDAAAVPSPAPMNHDAMRLLVGPWDAVSKDPAAAQVDEGPGVSGVFARFGSGDRLIGLNDHAQDAAQLGQQAGLVAALRLGDDPPTLIATGNGAAAVDAAVNALDESSLRDHYAVGVVDGHVTPLPVQAPR
jgi:hypothetical protein